MPAQPLRAHLYSVEHMKSDIARGHVIGSRILLEPNAPAAELTKQHYGTKSADGAIELSQFEAIFLAEQHRLDLVDSRKKKIASAKFKNKILGRTKNSWVKFTVFADLRKQGYTVKTALKFGADFRVYDKNVVPGEDHARWVVYAVPEQERLTWYDFSAKNRVAHSTKKKLLLGVVDEEGDVSYWECRWIKP